jgi:hypothetical protein
MGNFIFDKIRKFSSIIYMAKNSKKEDAWFIISKSGNEKIGVGFYDNRGKNVNPDKLDIKFRNSNTGRFISREFHLGRDSKTGEFIPVKEAQRRPNTTTVERIPKAGKGSSVLNNSPIYFKNKKNE